MTHHLKTWREPFTAIFNGIKRHEFRKEDDKIYCEDDVLILQEFIPCISCEATGVIKRSSGIECCPNCLGEKGAYTGRELRADVLYVTRAPDYGMQKGFAVMTIRLAGDVFVKHNEPIE